MKRLIIVAAICLGVGHTLGEAQYSASRFTSFADTGRIVCVSWNRSPAAGKFESAQFLLEGTRFAWVYGFVAGAAYMSEERLARIDAATADIWMDKFCDDYPTATVANAVAALVDELANRR